MSKDLVTKWPIAFFVDATTNRNMSLEPPKILAVRDINTLKIFGKPLVSVGTQLPLSLSKRILRENV